MGTLLLPASLDCPTTPNRDPCSLPFLFRPLFCPRVSAPPIAPAPIPCCSPCPPSTAPPPVLLPLAPTPAPALSPPLLCCPSPLLLPVYLPTVLLTCSRPPTLPLPTDAVSVERQRRGCERHRHPFNPANGAGKRTLLKCCQTCTVFERTFKHVSNCMTKHAAEHTLEH